MRSSAVNAYQDYMPSFLIPLDHPASPLLLSCLSSSQVSLNSSTIDDYSQGKGPLSTPKLKASECPPLIGVPLPQALQCREFGLHP